MPLTRYLIRNENGLADPQLYAAADKDDPEALLEGVAMAGLVGVLRQLGDLAEFAAEIFHYLHEEVMATAARGHSLLVRVQHLESEFPSIEKVFLSQTNNTSFFFTAGVDWHPNLHSRQNLISHGDLPRFVMDSYEDCRGPPRLFLLDKFDVAGAGACLKRYSDPSFFLVDSTSSNTDAQRDTTLRKVKKKRSRWKNGETPDIGPASHVNLQQLLMEERIENGYTNPTRLVKLKKRQLSDCGVDSKTGRSYMEKFLEILSPEEKMVCGTSVTPYLQLASDDIGGSGLNTLEIGAVSSFLKLPVSKCMPSSCIAQEQVLNPSINGELTGREIVRVRVEQIPYNERNGSHPILPDMRVESEAVNREGKPESSVDGFQYDDVISEVDNYMDALNTMESELKANCEFRSKDVRKNAAESDVNEEHLGIKGQFLDTESIGSSRESDAGDVSFVQENSSFICSSAAMDDDKPSDGDGSAELVNSTLENQILSSADIPLNLLPVSMYSQDNVLAELGMSPDTAEKKVSNSGEVSSDSCYSANLSLPPSKSSRPSMPMSLMMESSCDKTALDHVGYDSRTTETGENLHEHIVALADVTSQTSDDNYKHHRVISEKDSVNECNGADLKVNPDVLLHSENALVADNEPVNKFENKILQVECQNENSFESFVDDTCVSSSSADKLLFTSISPKLESCSGDELSESLTILSDFSSDVKSNDPTSTIGTSIKEDGERLEELFLVAHSPGTESLSNGQFSSISNDDVPQDSSGTKTSSKEQFSNIPDDVPRADLVESNVICPEEIKGVSRTDDGDIGELACNEYPVVSETPLIELQSTHPTESRHVHENSDCYVTQTIKEGSVYRFSSAAYTNNESPSLDYFGSESAESFANVVTEAVQAEAMCDSVVDHTETAVVQAVVFELPSMNTDGPCYKDLVELNDVPGKAFLGDVIIPAVTIPNSYEFHGVDEDSHLSLDLISSPGITKVWEQNQSGDINQQQNQTAFNEAVGEGGEVETEIKERENQLEVPSHLDADRAVSYDYFNLEANDKHSVHGFPQGAPKQDTRTVDEASLPPISVEATNLDLQPNATHLKDPLRDTEVVRSSPPCFFPVLESPVEPFAEVQPNQLQIEHMPAVAAISYSSNLHELEMIQSLIYIDRQKCEELQSSTLGDVERNSDASSKSPPEILQLQSSQSESTQGHHGTTLTMGLQQSFQPSLVISSDGEPINLEEMPPLPPLPPMLWRLGKVQPTFRASHREWVETSKDKFQSLPPSKMDKTPKDFLLESSQGIVQTQNPFMFLKAGEHEKSNHIPGDTLHKLAKSNSLSLPSSTMFNNTDHQFNSLSLDDKYSVNPFVTIPMTEDEKLECSSGQLLLLSDSIWSLVSRTEDGIVKHGTVSSSTKSFEPQDELLLEPGLESDMLLHAPQNLDVKELNPHVKLEAPLMKHEQHRKMLVIEGEGEIASTSNASDMMSSLEEAGQSNEKPPNKIPRSRSPLIDAVAAHDKRLLRKATERILPQVVTNVDERDSLLQQIRAKSFNLKPAVVTRPIIQGPNTNLKVAAILQRANAIRQACAGSDEDDDADNWSDSD